MSGFSARHGGHHDAQKLIHTGLPMNELSCCFEPSVIVSTKSGAGLPIFGSAPCAEALGVNDWLFAAPGFAKKYTAPAISTPTSTVATTLRSVPGDGRQLTSTDSSSSRSIAASVSSLAIAVQSAEEVVPKVCEQHRCK